jgi:superfamily II DNA or RNA helicase
MMELRKYQQDSVDEIRTALAKYRHVCFQLSTGAGKTLIFSYITLKSQRFNRKVLILSSRTEILIQNGGALQSFGLVVDYINPKCKDVPENNCAIAMAQTLRRRIEQQKWRDYIKSIELLIIDECHECVGDFIFGYLSDKCFVLGVTATPQRSGNMAQLGENYRALVTGISIKELIQLGYLAKAHHYSIVAPKLDDIQYDSSIGDYNQRQLAKRFESRTLYRGVVSEYKRLVNGKKAICFCVSANQCVEVTKEFIANGVSAKYLLSSPNEDFDALSGERNELIAQFKRGEFQVLVNCQCLTAGFDDKSVEVIILNFATVSVSRYRQAVGRGSRVTDTKKEFYILDCGENYKRLGMYDENIEWCLWHTTSSGNGVPQLKECDPNKPDINGKKGCGERVPMTMKVCPRCGRIFVTEKHEYDMYLEEVVETSEKDTLQSFVARKKQEGWKMSRIMVAVALANADNVKKAFIQAYMILNPSKTEYDAIKFYFVWNKNVWSKIEHKKELKNNAENQPTIL